MDMDNYRDNLEHVVRPEDPEDRKEANSILLSDYEALYLRDGLTEFAAYDSETDEEEAVALAYVEYIDMVVRDERGLTVSIYAHTAVATDVLDGAMLNVPRDDVHGTVDMMVDDL